MSCQKYLFREGCSKKQSWRSSRRPGASQDFTAADAVLPTALHAPLPAPHQLLWVRYRMSPARGGSSQKAPQKRSWKPDLSPSGSLCSCNTTVTEGGKRAVAAWTSTRASIGPHPSALSPLGFGTVQAGAGRPCSDPAHAAAGFLSCQCQHLCSWSFLLHWLGFQPYQSSRGILLAYASARRGRNTQPSARRVLNSRFRWRWKAAQGQIWGAEGLDRFCDRFTQRILMYLLCICVIEIQTLLLLVITVKFDDKVDCLRW